MNNREIVAKIESGRVINVRVDVAEEIGLNEAIVLGQISYWLERSINRRDGMVWVYKTYDDWAKEFKWWSKATIRRAIKSLESSGLIVSTSEYNRMRQDATKWYTVPEHSTNRGMSSPCAQNEQPELQNEQPMGAQNEHTVNHRIPENTAESTQPPSMPTKKPYRRQQQAAEHKQLAKSFGLSPKEFTELTNAYLAAAGGRELADSDGPDADRELNKAKDSAATGLKMGIKTPTDVEARLAGHRQQWKEDSVPSYGQLLKAQPVIEQAVGISQPLIVEIEEDGTEW